MLSTGLALLVFINTCVDIPMTPVRHTILLPREACMALQRRDLRHELSLHDGEAFDAIICLQPAEIDRINTCLYDLSDDRWTGYGADPGM